MAKRPTLEEQLQGLAACEENAFDAPAAERLQRALRGRSGLLIARAARVILARRLSDWVPELVAAFDRLCQDGAKRDPQCRGKLAIVEVLHELGCHEASLLQTALGYQQWEPVYGGSVDTAGELRGNAAVAVVAEPTVDSRFLVQPLLVDHDARTRVLAVRALTLLGGEASECLLRHCLLAGEPDQEVVGELCGGLVDLDAERAAAFLADWVIADHPVIGAEAALALGQSRHPDAVPVLRQAYERRHLIADRGTVLVALFLLRREEVIDWLVEEYRQADRRLADLFEQTLSTLGDAALCARFGWSPS